MAQRRAEHDRRHMAFKEGLLADLGQHFARHLAALFQLFEGTWINITAYGIEIDTRRLARGQALIRGLFRIVEKVACPQVNHTAKALPGCGGPIERRAIELKLILDLIQELQWVERLAIHLVDESDNRNVAQAANLKQFQCLRFDPLCRVEHHNGAIGCGQRSIRIFRKVFVAWRIEQIVDIAAKLKRHHRGADRDAAIAFNLHPVRRRPAAFTAGCDLTRHPDRTTCQEEIFRQRRLTGIRVRDDRKRSATIGLF